jgi:hypothetical protein
MSHVNGSITRLLETFTRSQLRELDLSLATSMTSRTKPTNHKGFIQAIVKRYEGKKLAARALRLEALLPYKHAFYFTFSVPGGHASVERIKSLVGCVIQSIDFLSSNRGASRSGAS